MAVILRYFSEFGYLSGVLRKSSRSLSHLLMSSCTYCNLLSAVLCNWAEFNAHSAHCCRSDAIRLFQTFYIVVIEAIQKRAIKIIFECTRHMSYANSLYLTELSSLQHRRQQQARDFRSLLDPNSCLHSLLPTPRDPNLVATLRAARRFPALASRTKRYQCFINFGLLNYQ